jgi:hypothetical protein
VPNHSKKILKKITSMLVLKIKLYKMLDIIYKRKIAYNEIYYIFYINFISLLIMFFLSYLFIYFPIYIL